MHWKRSTRGRQHHPRSHDREELLLLRTIGSSQGRWKIRWREDGCGLVEKAVMEILHQASASGRQAI